jgi:hypothetical protein
MKEKIKEYFWPIVFYIVLFSIFGAIAGFLQRSSEMPPIDP